MLHIPQKWAIIALFVLTLAVGILIGLFIPRPAVNPFENRSFSGPPGPNGPRPEMMRSGRFLSQLNVSGEQKQRINEITETYRDSMFNLINQNRRETMQKVLHLRENLHSDMAEVLSEAQFQEWQRLYRQNIKRFGPPEHMGPGRDRPHNRDGRRGPNGNAKQGRGKRYSPAAPDQQSNSGQN